MNTLWGGVKADGTSFYFTAFSFFCGPLAILVTGLISQFSWTRLSLPVDRGTVLMYSAVGAIFIIGTIGTFYIIFLKLSKQIFAMFQFTLVSFKMLKSNLWSMTSLILVIHWYVKGSKVQVYFGKWCGFPNAYKDYGCPLPDFFNHNVVMHIIQVSYWLTSDWSLSIGHIREYAILDWMIHTISE